MWNSKISAALPPTFIEIVDVEEKDIGIFQSQISTKWQKEFLLEFIPMLGLIPLFFNVPMKPQDVTRTLVKNCKAMKKWVYLHKLKNSSVRQVLYLYRTEG